MCPLLAVLVIGFLIIEICLVLVNCDLEFPRPLLTLQLQSVISHYEVAVLREKISETRR